MAPDLVPKLYSVKRFKENEILKKKWQECNQKECSSSSSEESSSEDEDPPSKKSKLDDEIPQNAPEHAQNLQKSPDASQNLQKSPYASQNLQKSQSPKNSPIVQFRPVGTNLAPTKYVYQNI